MSSQDKVLVWQYECRDNMIEENVKSMIDNRRSCKYVRLLSNNDVFCIHEEATLQRRLEEL